MKNIPVRSVTKKRGSSHNIRRLEPVRPSLNRDLKPSAAEVEKPFHFSLELLLVAILGLLAGYVALPDASVFKNLLEDRISTVVHVFFLVGLLFLASQVLGRPVRVFKHVDRGVVIFLAFLMSGISAYIGGVNDARQSPFAAASKKFAEETDKSIERLEVSRQHLDLARSGLLACGRHREGLEFALLLHKNSKAVSDTEVKMLSAYAIKTCKIERRQYLSALRRWQSALRALKSLRRPDLNS